MAQTHLLHCFRDAFRLLPVKSNRATCFHGAEATTARADASQDHERGCFISPAFSNIWAACLLADGVQSFAAHQLLQIVVVFSPGGTHPEPFRTAFWNHGRHVVFLLINIDLAAVGLQFGAHGLQETTGPGSIHDTMVEREAEVHHGAHSDRIILDYHRPFDYRVHAENSGIWLIDNRH